MELTDTQTKALQVLKDFSHGKLTAQAATAELIALGEHPASAADIILSQSGSSDAVGMDGEASL